MTYTPPEGVTIGAFTADTLPASFSAPADAVVTYKIYGTSAGAGVETESGEPAGFKIPILLNITKTEYSATSRTIEQGKYSTNQGSEITGIADTTKIRLSSYTLVSYNDTLVIDASVRANIDCSVIFTDVNNVVVGSTAWVSLPYTRTINYKNVKKCYVVFSKTNDSSISPSDVGTVVVTYKPVNSSNYDLFIGDSKLYEDEYVDYTTQKIYKLQEGVLVPTDPPLPLPSIITYDGENTISSTESLGDVELTGEWTAIMGSTEDESIDIGFTVDAEEYIASVTVDDGPSIQVSDTITMPSSAVSFSLEVVAWGREQYTDTVYNALS